jgi:cytochrome c553
MRIGWKHVGAFLTLVPAAGLLVVWSGMIDIRASTGHWRVTDWFLHWAMHSSVRTAALQVAVPDLSNPSLLPTAAGHFETSCAICHGSPVANRAATVLGMLPPPPDLADVAGSWTDAQLFEIVKHGVRYTGMPAWPAIGRDDEVWSMVAFVKALPQMTPETYRQLSGNALSTKLTSVDSTIAYCDSCHATKPANLPTLAPFLSGQSETYLRNSLNAYATGARPSGIMEAVISRVDKDLYADLAAYYARQARAEDDAAMENMPSAAILKLVQTGSAERKIPACLSCHSESSNPNFPRLNDLSSGYIAAQLHLFSKGVRGGTSFAHLMVEASKNIDENEIAGLSNYFGKVESRAGK